MIFRSIQQRMFFLLLVPVVLLLLGLGLTGFFMLREILIDQWKANTQMGMQRAAHSVDMRLERYRLGITLASEILGMSASAKPAWKQLLDQWPGVAASSVTLKAADFGATMPGRGMGPAMFRRHQAKIAEVSPPKYDARTKHTTLGMTFDLVDKEGQTGGVIRMEVSFAYLVSGLQEETWWKEVRAYLVTNQGKILIHTKNIADDERIFGDDGDPLKLKLLAGLEKSTQGTMLGEGRPPKIVGAFQHLKMAPWSLVVIAPGEELLEPIMSVLRTYTVSLLACAAIIALLIRFITGRLAKSIYQVSQAAQDVARGKYRKAPPQPGRDEISRLVESFNQMVGGLEERDRIRDTFGRYVDPAVAKRIMGRPEAALLGGSRREVSIMMTDLRNFTPLCESLEPEKTVDIINRYFSEVVEVVRNHDGIIVDFVGDAVLAFFDTMEDSPEEAACRAANCALDILEANRRFNRESLEKGDPELQTGIGVNSGEVVVGNMGSKARTKYGILGTPGEPDPAGAVRGQGRPGGNHRPGKGTAARQDKDQPGAGCGTKGAKGHLPGLFPGRGRRVPLGGAFAPQGPQAN